MTKLLLVEDEKEFAAAVKDWLTAQGYIIDCAHTGPEALSCLKTGSYDLVILDLNLPGLSGIDVCRTYRMHGGQAPMIMLTGNKTIDDKELGFDAGADDYLTKPFQLRELSVRVKALLKRGGKNLQDDVLVVRDLELDRKAHRVTRAGKEIDLLPKEFALLEFFMKNPGEVFSADALIQRIWPSDAEASPETIRSYMTRIRNKLQVTDDAEQLLVTKHGVGYKLQP